MMAIFSIKSDYDHKTQKGGDDGGKDIPFEDFLKSSTLENKEPS